MLEIYSIEKLDAVVYTLDPKLISVSFRSFDLSTSLYVI